MKKLKDLLKFVTALWGQMFPTPCINGVFD